MSGGPGRSARARLVTLLLKGLSATWRIREEIPAECAAVVDGEERAVVAFWHGKMLPIWYRLRGERSGALVSRSHDGELLADYLEHGLGYGRVIRGSSSKEGRQALADLVSTLAARRCLITPDGPRGPVRRGKPGALIAASRAGVPLVLAGWECRRVKRLGSWDGMEIPYPFAKVYLRYCMFDVAVGEQKVIGEASRGIIGEVSDDAGVGASDHPSADVTDVSSTTVGAERDAGDRDDGARESPGEDHGGEDHGGEDHGGEDHGDEDYGGGGSGQDDGSPRIWIGPELLARFDAELDRISGISAARHESPTGGTR